MNKKAFIILIALLFIVEIITYLDIYPKFIGAYMAKPMNGHSWTEMECTEGLCVTADNRVGIGVDSPSEKLEVYGDILVTEDACNGDGYCLSDLDVFY